ncbi:class I SAM-dependent methyltransferase [Polynucleobacter sp. AP-Kolm-20A-A1]|uniref:class I SAM-dependent methyltransferase n=1 Tax=Polynucleobacter sp. AP-Kolm-20A-A1 TaxID=2081041 RepID=UPI001BFD69F1|nr:class I SAM-dependent methyltransferase [Polynucleobacter sp. AP-Kolm-20A-A1]QWE20936.1 class I SAM-dependent methyltransferase [Polynucleobacter sp. AP-Kolm-20A-A1]
MNNLGAHLDLIAANYHLSDSMQDKHIEEISQVFAVSRIAQDIKPSDSILELGYGDGITTQILSEQFENYSVIEGSKILFDIASKLFPRVNFIHSFFEVYEPSQPYNKVLALHVFEHVDNPIELLLKLRSWVSDNGELIVIVPNSQSFHRRLALEAGLIGSLDELSSRDKMVGHLRVYNLSTLTDHLQSAGFEIIESTGLFFKPFANSQLLHLDKNIISAMNSVAVNFPAEFGANLLIRARKC